MNQKERATLIEHMELIAKLLIAHATETGVDIFSLKAKDFNLVSAAKLNFNLLKELKKEDKNG